MKLQFLGANRQVTGSRYLLEAADLCVVVDCGLFQERQFLDRNWQTPLITPRKVDYLLLTHAHLDHVGLIPRLVQLGFKGRILATAPTVELAEIVLRDSAKIQHEDAAYKKKRHRREKRKGKYPEEPLYSMADVEKTLGLFQEVSFHKPESLNSHLTVTWHEAGHILGAGMLEMEVKHDGGSRRIVFSGDIGQWGKPIIRDPSLFDSADYVIMESTYGDRDHRDHGEVETQLADVINPTVQRGGNVVIPTFAIERAQELMYHLSRLAADDRIPELPVYLDSPMAVNVTDVFRRYHDFLNEEIWEMLESGNRPFRFDGLKLVRSVEESKKINKLKKPAVIMAGSGMCTGGRIKHHLRNNLTRSQSTILFVGYQSRGTLGRQIVEGAEEVRIHGRKWPVRAQVAQIQGLSAHADRNGLLKWLGSIQQAPRQVFLTHGEEDAALELAAEIEREKGWPVTVPQYRQSVELD